MCIRDRPNGDEVGFVSSIKHCSQRRDCINTLLDTSSVNREISFSSQESVQGGILEPDLWIILVGKAMLNSFLLCRAKGWEGSPLCRAAVPEDDFPVASVGSQHKDVAIFRVKILCSCHSQELLGRASGLTDALSGAWDHSSQSYQRSSEKDAG